MIWRYIETKELFLLLTIGGEHVLTEENEFFECIFNVLVLLHGGDGFVDTGLIVDFRLDKFIKIESIRVHSMS